MADPSESADGAARRPIAFGTSGWRGLRNEEFSLPRVRVAARAVAGWLSEECPGGEVVIARDTRPCGEQYVAAAAEALRARGFEATIAAGAVPTPAAVHAMRSRGAAAAIVFTASHNPPEYSGMKVFDARGGILDAEASGRIEALAIGCDSEPVGGDAGAQAAASGREDIDAVTPYLEHLLAAIDPARLRAADISVVYDAMHAAGAGVLDRALREAGVRVRTLRAEPAPDFGGAAPDPSESRLAELRAAVAELPGRVLGVATDGDADRFAIVTGGHCLHATDALALLVDHLTATGAITRGIAISRATGSLVERVARAHGLRVERHPIGFKHLSRALQSGAVDAAGEESGGFALAGFGCDKDGVLAGLLFAELLAAGEGSLAERLDGLRERHGAGVCGRTARACDEAAAAALEWLAAAPPARFDGARVVHATHGDGLHLELEDGFVMLRRSGTEPLLRIYAEAPDPTGLARRLAAGRALLPD